MKTIRVVTGYGFFRDGDGHIVGKAELPMGDHPLRDGFDYFEVPNQPALDAIQIWQDPADVQRRANEAKITDWIADWLRTLAIQDLTNKGELPAGYE